jgi:riboflavin kinase / FMN adenylyltransferase
MNKNNNLLLILNLLLNDPFNVNKFLQHHLFCCEDNYFIFLTLRIKEVKVYYELNKFKAINPVVTIGTFDGVHLGHRKVLKRLKEIAADLKGETVIFTFHPHPRQILTPEEHNLRLINTLDEKIALLRMEGIDHVIVFPFTEKFSNLSYTEFVEQILVKKIKTTCLVFGYDHKFGKGRQGDFEYLQQCASRFQFKLERLDVLLLDEISISSTRIREALEHGNIRKANSYLGYPYELHGRVVEGRQLGREIGFPTANIEASEMAKLIPGYGVYAVKTKIDGITGNGMLNIGTRPTFSHNADERSIEVNIFNFDEILYGKEISLFFIDKIRDENKFPDKEALIEQLHRDKIMAIRILSG